MVDILVARQFYRCYRTIAFAYIRGADSTADGLANIEDNEALRELFKSITMSKNADLRIEVLQSMLRAMKKKGV